MATKRCNRCGESKPIGEFYHNAPMADGRLNQCRACHATTKREWRRARMVDPQLAERERERGRRKARQERERHPERVRARKRARYLKRPPVCGRCGSDDEVQAHHPDYSRPLDVEWLCRECHVQEHMLEEVA